MARFAVVLITAWLAASSGFAGPQAKPSVTTRWVNEAKARIEEQLLDPGSVQYRRLWLASHETEKGSETVLCGELNAKNAMGGYTGFRPFISTLGPMVYMGDQIQALWPEYCANKVRDIK